MKTHLKKINKEDLIVILLLLLGPFAMSAIEMNIYARKANVSLKEYFENCESYEAYHGNKKSYCSTHHTLSF